MTNRTSGINYPSLSESNNSRRGVITFNKRDIADTLLLGLEKSPNATSEEVEKVVSQIEEIIEQKLVFNTKLDQGQITDAIVGALRSNYIKLIARSANQESISQQELDLTKAFLLEYEDQSIRYQNSSHKIFTVEGPNSEEIHTPMAA